MTAEWGCGADGMLHPEGPAAPRQARAGNGVGYAMAKAKEKDRSPPSAFNRAVGRRLKWARMLVEPNMAEFARHLRMDRTTIRDIENGSRSMSFPTLIAICHYLRVHPGYLLFGELRGTDPELARLLRTRHPHLVEVASFYGTEHTDGHDNNDHPVRPAKTKTHARYRK